MAEEKVYNEGTTDETVVTKEDSKVKSFFKRKIDWVKNHPVIPNDCECQKALQCVSSRKAFKDILL